MVGDTDFIADAAQRMVADPELHSARNTSSIWLRGRPRLRAVWIMANSPTFSSVTRPANEPE